MILFFNCFNHIKKKNPYIHYIVIMLFAHYFLPPLFVWYEPLCHCGWFWKFLFHFLFYFLVFKMFLIIQLAWKKMSYFISLKKGKWCMLSGNKKFVKSPTVRVDVCFFLKTKQVLVKNKNCRFNIVPWSSFPNPLGL